MCLLEEKGQGGKVRLCVVSSDFYQETILESESLISASSLCAHVCVCTSACERVWEANDFDVLAVFVAIVCFPSSASDMMRQHVWLVECMTRLKRVAVPGGWGCQAAGPLRQSASATKRVANIACLAFSEGNRSIDFWLCSLFYLHRRVLVPGE